MNLSWPLKPFFYSSLEPLFGPRSVSKKFQNIGTKPPLERADSNSTLGESPCPDDQITLYQGFRAVYPRLAKPMIRAGLPEKARHQMLSIQHIASLFTELLDERDVLIQGKDAIDEKQSDLRRQLEKIEDAISRLTVRKHDLNAQVHELGNQLYTIEETIETLDERINSIGDETIHVEKTIRSIKGDSALFIKELEQIAPNSCFKTLYGHTNLVECLDFNDPFSTLVTGSADKSLKVWDLSSNMCIGNLIGHTGWVRSVQIDNYSVISGSGDCTMKHWDTSTLDSGICTSDMEFTGHSGGVSALQFAQGVLVSGSADTTIKQWDMRTGTNIQTLRTSRSIRDDSCDTLIYGGSTINRDLPYTTAEFQGWSETAIEPVDQVVSNTGGAVCSIYFWEHALAGGYGDGVIRLWDLRAGTYHRELTGHSASVTAVQFDSNYIFSGSTDGRFNVWDIRGGAILQTIEFTQGITDLHVDSSLVSIANGSIQISIYRRDSESISHLGGVDGHNKVVRTVKHMNGRLISGAMDNTVRIWKLG